MRRTRSLVTKFRKNKYLTIAAGLLVLIIVTAGFGILHHAKQSPQGQMKQVVAQVGKILELPTNEQPTLATVTNATDVRKQPFFIHAQTGDKLLLYATNKWAVLYRPSANKIINVGPINGTVSYTQFSAAIRDGTTDSQLAETVAGKITSSFPNGKVVEKSTAHRTDFPTSIVIAVNDKDQDLAAQIADALGMQVGNLPIGETAPTSDILIIIGQDYDK